MHSIVPPLPESPLSGLGGGMNMFAPSHNYSMKPESPTSMIMDHSPDDVREPL